jgi:hypothetical protein
VRCRRDRSVVVEPDEGEDPLALVEQPDVVAQRHAGREVHGRRRHRGQIHRGEAQDASGVVTAPISVRVVVVSVARMASCLRRGGGEHLAGLQIDPHRRPVVDSTTTVGASAICVSTGPWRRALGGAALRSRVRRGSVGLGGGVELGRDLARSSASLPSSSCSAAISASSCRARSPARCGRTW